MVVYEYGQRLWTTQMEFGWNKTRVFQRSGNGLAGQYQGKD